MESLKNYYQCTNTLKEMLLQQVGNALPAAACEESTSFH